MKKPRILFWTQGSSRLGLGLVIRMLALANKLRRDAEILFFINANEHAMHKVRESSFRLQSFPSTDELDGKERALDAYHPDVVITDIKKPEDSFFRKIKERVPAKIATFDELNRVKLHSDLVINYNTFDPIRKFRSTLSTTRFFFGPKYAILRDEFRKGGRPSPPVNCRRILVAFGGSDPLALTPKVVEALASLKGPFTVDFVLGAAFPFDAELAVSLKKFPHKHRILRDAKNMAALLRRADFVVTAGGTIMYEALFLRRPVLTLCQAPHQNEFATQLAKRGAVVNLGLGTDVTSERIASEIARLASQPAARRALVRKGSGVIDGKGADRLVVELKKLLKLGKKRR